MNYNRFKKKIVEKRQLFKKMHFIKMILSLGKQFIPGILYSDPFAIYHQFKGLIGLQCSGSGKG